MDQRSKRIGERIRQLREARGLTLQDVADAIGVTRQQVGRLETGARTLKPDTLRSIARALDVPVADLEGEGADAREVASLLRLLGYQTDLSPRLADDRDIAFDADIAATLTTGPIQLKLVVRCTGAVGVGDIRHLADFVSRSAFHKGIVVCGSQLEVRTLRAAEACGVDVMTREHLVSHLVDLEPYARRLSEEFQARQQPYVQPTCCPEGGDELGLHDLLRGWLEADDESHLALLGEPGSGKSTACAWLAAHLAHMHIEDPSSPAPILVSLRRFPYFSDMRRLIFDGLLGQPALSGATAGALDLMWSMGRFILILDGFDEMAVRSDPWMMRANMRAIQELLRGRGRVVLTSRTQAFRDQREESELLGLEPQQPGVRLLRPPGRMRLAYLRDFDRSQVESFLRRSAKRSWQRYLERIEERGLGELARRPFVLDLLTRNPQYLIRASAEAPTLSSILGLYVERCAEDEAARACIPRSDLLYALGELVLQMWYRDRNEINYHQLPQDILRIVESAGPLAGTVSEVDHAVRTSFFLQRDPEGNYRFVHSFFREYLFAWRICEDIRRGRADELPNLWLRDQDVGLLREMLTDVELGRVLADWLSDHPDAAVRSLSSYLLGVSGHASFAEALWRASRDDADPGVRRSALFALTRLGELEALRVLLKTADDEASSLLRSHARILAFALLRIVACLPESELVDQLRSATERWDSDELTEEALQVLADEAEDETSRCAAAELLGRIAPPEHLPRLEKLRVNLGQRLRMAIRGAIEDIGDGEQQQAGSA
jgi:transcriptional regulator with XRE-family HTH domain